MSIRLTAGSLFLFCLITGAFLGCGGANRTPAVRSTPDPVPSPQTVTSLPRVSSIRVLLVEGFDTCRIDGVEEGDGLVIEVVQGELRLVRGEGDEQVVLRQGSGFRLKAVPTGFVRVNGRAYRGDLEAFVNPIGTPVVVNQLPIEDYLRAVVPLELGPKLFPYREALSTQAVAARTFAVVHLGTWASRGFDLFGDTRSQVYGGVAAENGVSDKAIEQTRGRVSTYRGEPIVSLYSSTCGGVTEAFDLTFRGKPIEYLQGGVSCSDQDSQYYSWKETIHLDQVQESLNRYAGVGRLLDLSPVAYGRSERTVKMEFVGSDGTKVLKGNDIRFALGLRSNLITDLDTVKGPDGYIRQILVQGRGWGHGVGLCQMGAVNLARKGRTYDQILRHYYPGTAVAEWY
jgi:stage II sporulation protein D